jgi:hypothetical protein
MAKFKTMNYAQEIWTEMQRLAENESLYPGCDSWGYWLNNAIASLKLEDEFKSEQESIEGEIQKLAGN